MKQNDNQCGYEGVVVFQKLTSMSYDRDLEVTAALDKLDAAIMRAAASCASLIKLDERLDLRMQSYREVVARQRALAAELSNAYRRRDYREVSRISQLIQASSLMIKMDATYIITALRNGSKAAA